MPRRRRSASGLLLCGAPDSAPALFAACVEAGAQPLGTQALDELRIEAGVPWVGVDIDETTLVMETGRTAAISFTKGCYLGQEVVERIAARGHVNRQLAGVIIEGDAVPAAPARGCWPTATRSAMSPAPRAPRDGAASSDWR